MHLYALSNSVHFSLLASLVYAHVKLEAPVPYGVATLNTEPLESTGVDWPCKERPGGYEITKWNIMPINSPQTLKFQGQATHGGGSCQIALTKDTPPTKDSKFKVIKSIEGGCPSTAPGNVGTNPMGYGADTFNFTIPEVISPANYTLAWTWFNKIGNREMYMNCVPVTVTSTEKKRRQAQNRRRASLNQRTDGMSSLPDLFRANSGNGCSTAESGTILAIPAANLGNDVQRIGSDPLTPPVGNCVAASSDNSSAANAEVQPATPSSSSQSSTINRFSAAPVASSSALSTSPVASTTPAPQSPTAQLSSSEAALPPAGADISTGLTRGTCDTPGKSVCSPDGKAWGTCEANHEVIYQAVAAGTKCDQNLGTEVQAK